ncbi:MAG: Cof-type HAD-IIB family hydrolase [Pseudomonadota bacterium]
MDLIFFDLDGTLLNKSSELTSFTRDTLNLLREKGIAHTVATGRTMVSAKRVLDGHSFDLPHIYSNGVTVWDPRDNGLTLENLLSQDEAEQVIDSALSHSLAPFVNTVASNQNNHDHIIFHGKLRQEVESNLVKNYFETVDVTLQPLKSLDDDAQITNISMIGETSVVRQVQQQIEEIESLVAYSGQAIEGAEFSWIDIHHRHANKGSAIENLKTQLGASNIICFGDSYNDLSMFKLADECYAPENAKCEVKEIASAVIGHHHDDGVALFLRERFSL